MGWRDLTQNRGTVHTVHAVMTEALTSCGPCGHGQPGLCLPQQAWPFLPSWDSASIQVILPLRMCSLLVLPHVLRGDMSVEALLQTICVTPPIPGPGLAYARRTDR